FFEGRIHIATAAKRDLTASASDRLVDVRSRLHDLIENDRHWLVHVSTCEIAEFACSDRIECELNDRTTVLVHADDGVRETITRYHFCCAQKIWNACLFESRSRFRLFEVDDRVR